MERLSAGVSRCCSPRTPPTYQERVLEGLRLPTRAHARPDPGSRSASPSRVPELSQLLLWFAAGATSKGCGHPGVERRGSAKRWGAVGRRGHRGLDVGKHFPTSAKGRRGGTKQVSLSRAFGAHTPLRRGIWMDQMTSRARPLPPTPRSSALPQGCATHATPSTPPGQAGFRECDGKDIAAAAPSPPRLPFRRIRAPSCANEAGFICISC